MKKILVMLSTCALVACTGKTTTDNNSSEAVETEVEVVEVESPFNTMSEDQMTKVGNEFLTAVVNGDLQKALTYFSRNYVAEEHDQFLNGRTSQFITEFFAMEYTNEEGNSEWKNIDLSDIKAAKVVKADSGDGLNGSITIELEMADGKKYTGKFTMEMEMPNSEAPTLYGAVG